MEVEAQEEGSVEEHEKARIPRDRPLGLMHTGNRYAFGYGPDLYGIWDSAASGPPAEQFPPTDQGRQAGWQRYLQLEPSAAGTVIAAPSPDEVWRREVSESRKHRRRRTLLTLAIIAVVVVGGAVTLALKAGGGAQVAVQDLTPAAKAKKAHIGISGAATVTEDLSQTDFSGTPVLSLIGASNKGIWKGISVELTIDIHNPAIGAVSTTVIPPRTVTIVITQSDGTTATLVSTHGECTVTMDGVGDLGFSGTFECTGLALPGGAGTIDATGDFGASK
jgi:hypothetical protein